MHNFSMTSMLAFTLIGCAEKESDSSESEPQSEQATDTAPKEIGPEVWSGASLTFEKEDGADPEDSANQDAITELVVLTRADRGSLYNVVVESGSTSTTPTGTEWAMGTTGELEALEFLPLKEAANYKMQDLPGVPLVLHLIEEDIYIDLTFLSWTSGGSGGGFSYERSTP